MRMVPAFALRASARRAPTQHRKKGGPSGTARPSASGHAQERLTRISHSVEAHRGANQRKLLCSNDFSLIQGAPRCRQSVAQNDLILEWWKVGLWKRPLMAGW